MVSIEAVLLLKSVCFVFFSTTANYLKLTPVSQLSLQIHSFFICSWNPDNFHILKSRFCSLHQNILHQLTVGKHRNGMTRILEIEGKTAQSICFKKNPKNKKPIMTMYNQIHHSKLYKTCVLIFLFLHYTRGKMNFSFSSSVSPYRHGKNVQRNSTESRTGDQIEGSGAVMRWEQYLLCPNR